MMAKAFPDEPKMNAEILTQGKSLKIYYGANSWGRKDWVGEVYPIKAREKEFLSYYVEHFNAVELNATHYQDYTREEIKRWADKAAGKDFVFCPKIPQRISHYSSFVNIEDKTRSFLESILAFADHLGPVVLQVSDRFSPKKKESLYNYLGSLPENIPFFLEVRNPEWFEDDVSEEHLRTLKAKNIGTVIHDSPERIINLGLSIPKCFVRYTPTGDLARVQQWFDQIKEWQKRGLTEAYFFVETAMLGRAVHPRNPLPEYFPPLEVEKPGSQLEALQYFKELVSRS